MLTAAALQAGGANVCVLDTDPQGSATAWAAYVDETGVPLRFPVIPSGLNFPKQIPPGNDWIILDTPPGNPDIIQAARSEFGNTLITQARFCAGACTCSAATTADRLPGDPWTDTALKLSGTWRATTAAGIRSGASE